MTTGDSEAVASDAFFGVVRRRHPDLDIVLLPQPAPAEQPAVRLGPADVVDVPARFDAELPACSRTSRAGSPAAGPVALDARELDRFGVAGGAGGGRRRRRGRRGRRSPPPDGR